MSTNGRYTGEAYRPRRRGPVLVLTCSVNGVRVNISISDIDGFVHAAPDEWVVVGVPNGEEEVLGQYQKKDLLGLRLAND